MRYPALLPTLLLAAAAASAAPAPAPSGAGSAWRYFMEYDYFAPADSGQGLRDQLHLVGDQLAASGAIDSSQTQVHVSGGSGTRVGALRRWGDRSWLSGSLGYVLGPSMNANFSAVSVVNGNGGLSVNRAASYVTLLVGTRTLLLERGPWTTGLDSELGLGVGHVDQSCNSSGSVSCAGLVDTARKTWAGFAWSFSLRESRRFELVDLSIGLRYAGFPRFRGNDSIAAIRWEAAGAFAAARF